MTKTELDQAVNARLSQIKAVLSTLEDATAVELITLFPVWATGASYTADERVSYADKLYRCVQSHTSQADWTPDATPALWTEVAKPGEIPVWKQPTGAQDAYQKGDKVHYPGNGDPVYISTVDNNVWEPGVYGWDLA